MLTFRCDDCDLDFASEPDVTGYDQAPCPSCGRLCVTLEFIEQERRRNRLPIRQFTLRTLLLAVAISAVFLGLSVQFRSYFCTVAYDGYTYGFPFRAVRIPNPGSGVMASVGVQALIGDVLAFLMALAGVSGALNWIAWRAHARRRTTHSR